MNQAAMSKRYFFFFRAIVLFLIPCLSANLPLVAQSAARQPERQFQVAELRADLRWYREALQRKHPNLHVYTPEPAIDAFFDSLDASIRSPMTEREFFNLLTLSFTRVRDGHTHIFPSDATNRYLNESGRFLPVKLVFEEGEMRVAEVYCPDSPLPPGARILSINKQAAGGIWTYMMERQIRDGYNETYPAWILNRWFKNYYAFHFGCPETFEFEYRLPGQTETQVVAMPALSQARIDACRSSKEPGLKTQGISLSIDTAGRTAVLRISDFHSAVLKKQYGQRFKPVISAHFQTIRALGIEHLILDLRDNQGGDLGNGAFLLKHLIDHPFKIVEGYGKARRHTTSGPRRVRKVRGPAEGWQKPVGQPFTGRLYVLVNGGSFSNSGIVSSGLRRHTRCLIIGEETGGNPDLLSAGGRYQRLPNTGLKVLIPKRQFRITGPAPGNGRGLMPDHVVRADSNRRDSVLQFTLQRIDSTRR